MIEFAALMNHNDEKAIAEFQQQSNDLKLKYHSSLETQGHRK